MSQLVGQFLTQLIFYLDHSPIRGQLQQEIVTGAHFIYESQLYSLLTIPMLTCCHLVQLQLRPIATDKVLEQQMGFFQFLLKLGSAFISILTKECQGTLKVAGGMLFIINVMLLQQLVKVR